MVYISNYFSGNPIYDETVSKLRNKSHENVKQAFDEFIEAQNEQPDTAAPDVDENNFVDNGVKSTLMLSRLDSHKTDLNCASYAIDETDFKVNQGKRMNYYSTQKWDIGVYQDNSSTESNPSVLVSVDESESGGSRKIYRVHINEVNIKDAACYEMFGAICYKTENWFDALSSFKWALDNNYGMDRVKPDGSTPAYHVEQQLHPYDRLNFQETFRIAVERLTADYDERLENVRTTLLNMITNTERKNAASDVHENTFVDNGVKSTLIIGRIAEQKQSAGAVTHMDLSEGVPEGLVKTNAGGYTYTGDGRKVPTQTQDGIVYHTNRDIEYKLITYYDSNSPEDEPVMYIYKKADQAPNDELIKIEVNKVNPSNASYEEMLAVVGYIYRDDPKTARDAADAVDMARDYIELDGFDAQNGSYDYTGYLHEVVRRNKDYPNPANRVLAEAAENLLDYLKDYPRENDNTNTERK